MTNLVILSPQKQRDFDAPSKLNLKKRTLFFSLDYEMLVFVESLRTATNQVGFILQLGYFRANGKFFTQQHFKSPDIDFVINMLNINPEDIKLSDYNQKTPIFHRQKIIEFLKWHPLDSNNQEKIKKHIQWHIPQQISPKRVFYSIIEYCCHNKIEIPSYNLLSTLITDAYNDIENTLIQKVTKTLTKDHREKLDTILNTGEINQAESTPLPSLAHLKKINQSLRPMDIKETLKDFELFKEYFEIFKATIDKMKASDQLTEYFATWVQKATPFQLNQFPDKNKTYLHLLCYLKHQFYIRHDLLADIFLKSTQAGINNSQKKETKREEKNRKKGFWAQTRHFFEAVFAKLIFRYFLIFSSLYKY